jgi:hypothetical protein
MHIDTDKKTFSGVGFELVKNKREKEIFSLKFFDRKEFGNLVKITS